MQADDWQVLEKRLCALVAQYKRTIIAVSGGVDSMVLLHVLSRVLLPRQRQQHQVVTVHHGLSLHARQWVQLVWSYATELGFPCRIVRVRCRNQGEGIEAAARQARYGAFFQRARDWQAQAIFLAHHADDRLETFTLAWMRGQVDGLWGQKDGVRMQGLPLLRPMNTLFRSSIRAYAKKHNISFVVDESNADTRYARNYIRHNVIPEMKAWRPGTQRAMLKTIERTEKQHEVYRLLLARRIQPWVQSQVFPWGALQSRSPLLCRQFFRAWCQSFDIYFSETRFLDRLRQLEEKPTVAYWWQGTNGDFLRVAYQRIYYVKPNDLQETAWEEKFLQDLIKSSWMTTTQEGLNFLNRANWIVKNGLLMKEKLLCVSAKHRKTLKNLIQEKEIPQWRRARLRSLYWEDRLLWVEDVGPNEEWKKAWCELFSRE